MGDSTCVSIQVSSTCQDSCQEVHRYTLPSNMISLSGPLSAEVLSRSKKQQQRHMPELSGSVASQEIPLPDGLLERLQASSWNERHAAISDLEKYIINSRPQTMSSYLHRVSTTLNFSHSILLFTVLPTINHQCDGSAWVTCHWYGG